MTRYYQRALMIMPFLVVFISAQPVLAAKAGDGPGPDHSGSGIDFRSGFIKLSVNDEDLQKVINEVAEKTGMCITTTSAISEKITLDTDFMPLEKGLVQLLGGRDHILIYSGEEGGEAKLTEVLILPGAKDPGAKSITFYEAGKCSDRTAELRDLFGLNSQTLKSVIQSLSKDGSELGTLFCDNMEELEELTGSKSLALLIEWARRERRSVETGS